MDENNQPIVYVIDTRNGSSDHRTGGSGGSIPVPFGSRAVPVGATMQSSPMAMTAPAYRPRTVVLQQPAPMYAQAPGWASPFANLGKGDVVDLLVQGLVALMPLPAAPVATGDTNTDVQNHVLYQGALAQHAKRDEQFRTLGYGLRKLLA